MSHRTVCCAHFVFLGLSLFLFAACGQSPSSSADDTGALDTSDLGVIADADREDAAPDVTTSDAEDCDTLGCGCDTGADCRSGYCVNSPTAGRVCADFCVDDCPSDGYECRLLENSAGDAVTLCVPVGNSYCRECDVDTDCGSLNDLCLDQAEGRFCAPSCDPETAPCPADASCTAVVVGEATYRVCVPDSAQCTPCIDEDNDGRGDGSQCIAPDCDDNDPGTYLGAPEACDGRDNDCDRDIDEGFDFTSDADHCGGCGIACDGANAESACVDSACAIAACDEGYVDCDGDASNGCEVDAGDADACEACDPTVTVGGTCGTCDSGTWACDGVAGLCEGDRGPEGLNACGGCAALEAEPDAECGACAALWTCNDDGEAVACVADETDSDSDGVCDVDDICEGFDDALDADGDGTPDGCELECPEGFYGADCSSTCTCDNGTCDDGLSGTGACTCDAGFTGDACDSCEDGRYGADCDQTCDCGTGTCDDGIAGTGLCTCPDGAFGADCSGTCECVSGTCDEGAAGTGVCACDDGFTGDACDVCEDGRYGADCSNICDCGAGSCDDGLDGTGVCDCPDGTYGADCTSVCDCGTGACDDGAAGTGACICQPDTYGADCSGVCACENGVCDDGVSGTGACTCSSGYDGARCDVCEDGRYGSTCASTCNCGPGTCDDGLTGTGTCDCPAGRYGADCSGTCNCAAGSCDDGASGTGTCDCPAGRYGPTCASTCDCGAGSCDDGATGSGACTCPAGTYGADCSGTCDCGAGTCDDGVSGSGSCTCPTGFIGDSCEQCEDGRYGPNCLSCPRCGTGIECDDGIDGSGVCLCTPTGVSESVCNGVDDDCDGSIDENYSRGGTCGCLECPTPGTYYDERQTGWTCSRGREVCRPQAGADCLGGCI